MLLFSYAIAQVRFVPKQLGRTFWWHAQLVFTEGRCRFEQNNLLYAGALIFAPTDLRSAFCVCATPATVAKICPEPIKYILFMCSLA